MEKVFTCAECCKTYKHYRSLKDHMKKVHPDKLSESASALHDKVTFKHSCDECGKNFNDVKNLNFHKRSVHRVFEQSVSNLHCPMCKEIMPKNDIINHFRFSHDLTMETENLEFSSFNTFLEWKDEMEKDCKCSFTKKRGAHKTSETTKHYFICHRSGEYVAKGSGIRHLKLQGSKKIGGFCPAEIKVSESNDSGKVSIVFSKTHVGHQNELKHITLTADERHLLAAKIASKVPFDTILDEVRDSISEDGLQRIHLLTKKDIFNVANSFNLNAEAVRHKNDATSVEAWVNEMNSHDNPCVLFYKPQQTSLTDYPQLEKNDFVLVIMNLAQSELLRKYGPDCVCIDGTHGTNNYDFELTTLLILDDVRQGFPCAFLISNKSTEAVMLLFFSEIEKITGKIAPAIFMSDMADVYYSAWIKTMGVPLKRLFCSWHVDRAWRKNLCKIKGKEKQVDIYKILRTLMEERDEVAFQAMINAAVNNMISDNDTSVFGSYFVEYYLPHVTSWAYCYRMNCGLNTNMHIERMHKTIKYMYLQGKHAKRLDKTIHVIMKFIRDRLVDRLVVLHKGKLTSKISVMRKRHKESLLLSTDLIFEKKKGWTVSSSTREFETYDVEQLVQECSCQLTCKDCDVCIHKYSCTCPDASIKWNMCKHIHLICRHLNEKLQMNILKVNEDENPSLEIDVENEDAKNESQIIMQQLQKKCSSEIPKDDIALAKENLKRKFVEAIDNITTNEEIEIFHNILKSLDPTLHAVRLASQHSFSAAAVPNSSTSNIPHNKNIEPQRRLFTTKKKRKLVESAIVKPTHQELQNIALSLVLSNNDD